MCVQVHVHQGRNRHLQGLETVLPSSFAEQRHDAQQRSAQECSLTVLQLYQAAREDCDPKLPDDELKRTGGDVPLRFSHHWLGHYSEDEAQRFD